MEDDKMKRLEDIASAADVLSNALTRLDAAHDFAYLYDEAQVSARSEQAKASVDHARQLLSAAQFAYREWRVQNDPTVKEALQL